MQPRESVTPNPWNALRSATSARIALGRAGGSLPTREWLNFQSARAAARDAVHFPFDAEQIANEFASIGAESIVVDSAAADRGSYLKRPDFGRQLDDRSRLALQNLHFDTPIDLVIVVTDGLSAIAVHRQSRPLLQLLLPKLHDDSWHVAPLIIARFGRVAIEDEIGQLVGAQLALILIGERPGLGSPDSLGAYLVYTPMSGNTDANRNCVSNIRPEGLPLEAAMETILYLLNEARRRRLSGVQLKDERRLAINDLSAAKLSAKAIESDTNR
jgi:ethanolamine ammonia-lyase small subunit